MIRRLKYLVFTLAARDRYLELKGIKVEEDLLYRFFRYKKFLNR